MQSRIENRLARLEQRSVAPAPRVDEPSPPPDFTGTFIIGDGVTFEIPDNGRGPTDQPGPHIIRVGS